MNIIYDNNNELDVEKIMGEIRDNIKKRYPNYKEIYKELDTSTFEKFSNLESQNHRSFSILYENIQYNNENWRTFSEAFLSNKFIKIKDFVKRVIRKNIRWYISPALHNQNELNGSFTRSLNEITTIIHSQAQQIQDLEYKINKMNRQFNTTIGQDNFVSKNGGDSNES
ncbi:MULTISPECIES: hypothetical protein [unclassified Paenibacillus]|nr:MULTISPECIES: hypothetical protein [unclassified Paenibacillus]MBP1157469.1 hypothetical protein [Paenibacillus sp. PvP091]MBP2438175.1 hypothetical protein [Paenibacillus sp. PvP052]